MERYMEQARAIAAQCCCDADTRDKEMDVSLAESVACRIATWMEAAAQMSQTAEFYRGLIDECAEHLGVAAYTADDGTVMESPVRLKVPELVGKLREELAAAINLAYAYPPSEPFAPDGETWKQRTEAAEAKLKAVSEQRPIAYLHRTNSNIVECSYYGTLLPAGRGDLADEFLDALPLNRSVPMYTRPPVPAGVQELQAKYDRLDSIASESADLNNRQAQRIAELERKLAEQQVIITQYEIHELPVIIDEHLAKAREEGRKEAVPEIENICGVDLRGDFAVQLVFASCRSASAFADAMLAAVPKPEVKP